jgi:hypothetical protein
VPWDFQARDETKSRGLQQGLLLLEELVAAVNLSPQNDRSEITIDGSRDVAARIRGLKMK